jgi:NADH-quinone oxidoreductase subunit D
MMDSAARARQIADDAAAELSGEKMFLNLGPQHPSTHGVLRIVLELDGEVITNAYPDVGYLHRGDEKIAENMTYTQFIPYTDRLDYLAPLANNVAYTYAVEKLLSVDVPPRCKYIRVICTEMARISSHLLGLGAMAMDIGAMTVFLYTFRERETLYSLIELLCGARFTTSYTRIGGLANDLPEGFLDGLKAFVKDFPAKIKEYEGLLTRNKIFIIRMKDVGILKKEDAIDFGVTGPNLRGSGVDWDLRKAHPYGAYDEFDFEVPVGTTGDCLDRYLCRIEELRQSTRLLEQAIAKIEAMPKDSPVNASDPKIVLPPKDKVLTKMEELIHHFINVTEGVNAPPGEVYFSAENPKGELGFYIVSKGGGAPHRLKIRAPSFVNLAAVPLMVKGHLISDVVAILGSIDFVMGECDR